MKRLATILVGATLVTATGAASAKDHFGSQGTVVLGVDRVFGLTHTWINSEETIGPVDFDVTERSTNISVAWNVTDSPYSNTRVAADFFLFKGLSIGGSFGLVSSSNEIEFGGEARPDDVDFNVTSFLIAPRIGYAFMFTEGFGLWPRAGVTYVNVDDDDRGAGGNILALTAEAAFVFAPANHVAILLGPTLDWGVTGERRLGNLLDDAADADVDTTVREVGLQAGFAVYF
jgi:hypothetical protein